METGSTASLRTYFVGTFPDEETMNITRGYKTELDLNNKQITLCKKHAGCARFAYNWALKRKQEVYQATGRNTTAIDLHRELNALKQTEFPWMYEVSKCAPQEALRDADDAMKHFFRRCRLKKAGKYKGKLGYPRFKSKKKGLGSFRLTGHIHVFEQAIQLPRLGKLRLKEYGYLPTEGVHILSATVSEQAEHWFVSVQVEENIPDLEPATGAPIGVDLGIKTLAVCSDGTEVANPKALRKNIKKLIRAQRRLSRRKKGGKNRDKARKRVARIHSHIANIRRDALHKATTLITAKPKREKRRKPKTGQSVSLPSRRPRTPRERPHTIVMEDLNVAGMTKNHKLAQAISDVGMSEFKRQMQYKTVWNKETLLLANRFYPSTKRCSGCGQVKEQMSLAERVYVCDNESCKLVLDRDWNAALNLAALAHEV